MKNLRSYEIIDYLKQKKYCSVRELMEHFSVSSATIHRDIAALAAREVIRKVHGGVALREKSAVRLSRDSSPFLDRITTNRSSKEKIARAALSRVQDGDILFLDSSTTVSYLAAELQQSGFSNLTIITNSVTVIQNFHKFPSHYVLFSLGGGFDLQLNAFLGQTTLRELEFLTISKAFVSAFGIDDENIMTNHEHHAGLLMKVLKIASQKFLLADHSKFGRGGLFKFATRRSFDEILTDTVTESGNPAGGFFRSPRP